MKFRAAHLAVAILVPLLLALTELRVIPLPVIECPFEQYLGIHCPMCGTSRAWRCFAAGKYLLAFAYNPLFLFFGLACLIVYLDVVWKVFAPGSTLGMGVIGPLLRRPYNLVIGSVFAVLFLYNNFFNKLLNQPF